MEAPSLREILRHAPGGCAQDSGGGIHLWLAGRRSQARPFRSGGRMRDRKLYGAPGTLLREDGRGRRFIRDATLYKRTPCPGRVEEVETRLERLPGRLGPARSFDGTLAVGVLNYVQ